MRNLRISLSCYSSYTILYVLSGQTVFVSIKVCESIKKRRWLRGFMALLRISPAASLDIPVTEKETNQYESPQFLNQYYHNLQNI